MYICGTHINALTQITQLILPAVDRRKHSMTPGNITENVPQCTIGCNNNLPLPALAKQTLK